ncbi:MAG: hypothetical protein CMP76_03860 [Flavobacterium sp.]|uniref:hypothetical protein n=1 Tax=Flavobacterium sp. TaxID=239 RepID=UPI000C3EC50B|nr:hypothetical protein [Flavobacterium sp.]MBF02412.1 hypothetical protein [Flavobacterium sp.]|tara:strand:- start:3009 stop:4754 length:1746 start_codon:yes stop_codon:yes gene_type:complete
MFDNNNKIFAYKIALKLDPYLVALFNLCYDVYVKLENITVELNDMEHVVSLFSDDFYEMLGINKDEYLEKDNVGNYFYIKDQFFDSISSLLNLYFLKSDIFTNNLKEKEHLFYFKDTFTIYTTLGNNVDYDKGIKEIFNNLNNKFKSINVIAEILNHLQNQNLKDSIQSISKIFDFNKNGQYIKILNSEFFKPDLLSVAEEQINFNLLNNELFDFKNVWINFENELCKNLNFSIEDDEYYLISDCESNKVVGLKVNDRVLLKYNVDSKKYIKEENSNLHLWQLLKENYLRKRTQTLLYDSELIQSFKQKSKEGDFNKLLCHLKHNLYIDRIVPIKADYQCFFEEFIVLKNLNDLSNFNFFLPDGNVEKELLGIYTEQKIGKKYNLLHYLKHKDDRYTEGFVNSEPQKKEKLKVHILKAELSFYLVEKYYEDLIEDLLTELDLDFVSNVELCINGVPKAEFDFVIFKNNKFYFLEAKTTLTKDNVYDASQKYNNNIKYLKQITNTNLQDFTFILLGFLSHQNIDNYRHFFDDEVYNTPREGFAITPYKFKVPFFGHQGLELECIAEPELSKLKEFIKEICQI